MSGGELKVINQPIQKQQTFNYQDLCVKQFTTAQMSCCDSNKPLLQCSQISTVMTEFMFVKVTFRCIIFSF